MIRQQIRAPKIGDRVGVAGQQGTFEIIAVTVSPVAMAKLRMVGNPGFIIDLPWGAVKFPCPEDATKE